MSLYKKKTPSWCLFSVCTAPLALESCVCVERFSERYGTFLCERPFSRVVEVAPHPFPAQVQVFVLRTATELGVHYFAGSSCRQSTDVCRHVGGSQSGSHGHYPEHAAQDMFVSDPVNRVCVPAEHLKWHDRLAEGGHSGDEKTFGRGHGYHFRGIGPRCRVCA